ncbi:MAG: (2Fe-2S)-binding protein [Comamonadaceae bacterium]|nr:(2Fe-2S)-binding protein [Comamonadaceae bacterium]
MARGADAQGAARRTWLEALQPLLPRFRYAGAAEPRRPRPAAAACCAPPTTSRSHPQPPRRHRSTALIGSAGLRRASVLRATGAGAASPSARCSKAARLAGLRLTGETAAGAWRRPTRCSSQHAAPRSCAAGRSRPWPPRRRPRPGAAGASLCNCHDVAETEIAAAGRRRRRPGESLQQKLRCGTSCGSCMPELKRMIASGKVSSPKRTTTVAAACARNTPLRGTARRRAPPCAPMWISTTG